MYTDIYEELRTQKETNKTIKGYVYAKNKGGFLVSYNGYRCFAPYSEVINIGLNDENQILNSYQLFDVIKADHNGVILSKKRLNKNKRYELKIKEIQSFSIGFKFCGKVENIQGYGVFIAFQFSNGLLHASNITNTYQNKLPKPSLQLIEANLKSVFVVGREVEVFVEKIESEQYSLNWHKASNFNQEIYKELIDLEWVCNP